MTTPEARRAVIAEARQWVGTPFHRQCQLKGVGIDCGHLILACYAVAGIAVDIKPGLASRDWHLHREDTRFIDPVRAIGREIETPQPGDLVLFFIGCSWAHGAIVVDWPMVIQAKWNSGVQYADCSQHELGQLKKLFFSPWSPDPVPPTVAEIEHIRAASRDSAAEHFAPHIPESHGHR